MTSDPTPEVKALEYVNSLGLNSVHEEAQHKRVVLEDKGRTLAEFKARRRQLETYRADREMEVMEEERGRHPEMSQAQMDKHLKMAFSNDGDIRETRDELVSLAGDIDLTEFEVELLHQDIKIAVARLHELGGYFQFMAVIKQAEENRKAREATDKDPWR